jgi:5-deoxy-glucuronate isomerase
MTTNTFTHTTVLAPGACIVRNTAGRKGRSRAVAPGETPMRHLHYGRIVIEAGDPAVRFATGELETGLICVGGVCTVAVDGTTYELGRYDSLYVPRDSSVLVAPAGERCDLVEIAAPVSKQHPVQLVRFEDVRKDPGLHFETGGPAARRDLNILLGKNVQASRIMAGVTFSDPGNWTSWPPHEHAAMLEEAYLYVEMPPPGFGLQLVFTDARDPEVAAIVREGDIVLMPKGYHPNVAAPGSQINFIWMMAAHREDVDRQYGVVNVHPDFAAVGSGLDKGRSESK